MTRLFGLTILLFISSLLSGQTQLLKQFDFNKGGYYLLGVRSESDPNGLADTLGNFFTNDTSVLNAIKKEWTFKKPGKNYACGYHYIIHVCKDGKSLDKFALNLNCNEIVSRRSYFYFDSKKLRKFKGKLKSAYFKNDKFDKIDDARNYLTQIRKDSSLICALNPNWTDFEGRFEFKCDCPEKDKDCNNLAEGKIKKLSEEIKKNYPDEKFDLEWSGGSLKEVTVEVTCNKSLLDKFTLYPLTWKKWDPFDLYLTTFWRQKPK